jgi:GNAT superfamily N-acetyltransferase
MNIQTAETRPEIEFCKRALTAFRPNLNPGNFVEQVLRMKMEGFHLIYIADENNSEAAAIAGFRIFEMLRTDTIIYIDDLFTFEENRGKGYASALLDYIAQYAQSLNIKTVHLDSGFDLHPAHRLYLKSGYFLACRHFAKIV